VQVSSTGVIWLMAEEMVCPCKHGIEYLASITGRERLDYISDYQILTKDSGSCSYWFLLYI
jgi:hypothetical protein